MKESTNLNTMKPSNVRRKTLSISPEKLIQIECFQPENPLPLVIKPAVDGLNLITWATNNRSWIETQLLKHGGLLFRNFDLKELPEFEQFIQAISGELLEYSYRSTPRTQVSGNIYTSTEYPATQVIPLHNEMAYSLEWPLKIWFFCVKSAEEKGETPIADSRKVFERIDNKIKNKFIQRKVMYVRNYGDKLDLDWQNVFQTTNKTEVENYCRSKGIEFDWKGNQLRTRQVCQAVATHPKTGELVWFNQAHLFHVSSLNPEVYQSLLATFKEEDLPRNAYYGDGSPIETSVLDEIREIYQQETVIFPWQEGDILMLDNMLTAHGRMPFVGSRKVVVGMAEPFTNQNSGA
ncbi:MULTISPECIES: TauD/TfdA family dioxygenase [Cyanophyceae]|uniref:TauD/TfdA family dioxygenase n=1 Tax=Cyanophyceae TaxID=3028117 RepID=UPI0018EFD94F|nr:TauD/TfdA family dioxygenase [Trichocoleus sp. FACHB-69]